MAENVQDVLKAMQAEAKELEEVARERESRGHWSSGGDAREIAELLEDFATRLSAAVAWRPISDYEKRNPYESVIVAAPISFGSKTWVVGEAYMDPETGDWWWAGEGPGEYHASPIEPIPLRWMPLPLPPTEAGHE